ncbi:LLM class flavin-dependent oxidoreductase [Halorubrum luteum]
MNYDIGLFTCQTPNDSQPHSKRYNEMLELGSHAEACGFDKAWISEHHFVDDGYLPSVLSFCAALGARTKELTIGTGIALAPFYNPIRFAEDAATIDLVTDGRFEAGFAIGWTDEEFDVFDVPKARRVPYTEELIEIVEHAWTDGTFSYHGSVYEYDEVDVNPKPESDIPIWLGGTVDAAVERAARLGDGYFATPTPLDELVRRRDLAIETRRDHGIEEDEPFEIAEWRYAFVSEDGDAWERAKQGAWYIKRQYIEWATGEPQPEELPESMAGDLREECLMGTPEEVAEMLRRRRDAFGDDYRAVARMTLPGVSADAIRESMRLFGEEVVPLVEA